MFCLVHVLLGTCFFDRYEFVLRIKWALLTIQSNCSKLIKIWSVSDGCDWWGCPDVKRTESIYSGEAFEWMVPCSRHGCGYQHWGSPQTAGINSACPRHGGTNSSRRQVFLQFFRTFLVLKKKRMEYIMMWNQWCLNRETKSTLPRDFQKYKDQVEHTGR